MASLVLSGNTSGSITVSAPDVSGSNTQTLVAVTGTLAPIVSSTAVASTSGTSIDFTGIPSWVKRITVMFYAVSTNGTSNPLIQIGSGSFTTANYSSASSLTTTAVNTVSASNGFIVSGGSATNSRSGILLLTNITGNTWVSSHAMAFSDVAGTIYGGGLSNPLSGTLDRVRITTVNGTDTFDAGTINLLWE